MSVPTRRETLSLLAAAAPAASAQTPAQPISPETVKRHDDAADYYLKNQITDPNSRWLGALPDAQGLYYPASVAGMWDVMASCFVQPQSRHYQSGAMIQRMQLAARFYDASLSPDGNIYLPITNFNSPPDSSFFAKTCANTALMARKFQATEVSKIVDPRLSRLGRALRVGGIHTPNHRWVLCAALAQINELFPDSANVRRIDQWLAEGIDIDPDGQFSERSTSGYNAICCHAFTILADKLKRPQLLDPVRRNLDSMLYLLHADGEIVTEFSRRQDLNTRGTMAGYWYPLQYLSAKLGERKYGMLARQEFFKSCPMSVLMTDPDLNRTDFAADPLPDDYVRELTHNHVLRIRRGLASTTIHTKGRDRFLQVRYGDAVIEGVRFASAFFGKAQFVPTEFVRDGAGAVLTQRLEGPYFQPFTPTRKISADEWDETQPLRPRTEVCKLTQSAAIREMANGIRLEIVAEGTDNVPVAIEIGLREQGTIEGAEGELLTASESSYTAGRHTIRIKGGGCEHKYTQVRGARPRLPGRSVCVTGFTPFRRVLEFTWG